jgi:hypothetical protein
MSKSTKLDNLKPKRISQGMPLVVFVGAFGLGLLGYVFSQIVTAAQAHPIHWLSALGSAVLGGVLGWLWYRWHGDII